MTLERFPEATRDETFQVDLVQVIKIEDDIFI